MWSVNELPSAGSDGVAREPDENAIFFSLSFSLHLLLLHLRLLHAGLFRNAWQLKATTIVARIGQCGAGEKCCKPFKNH